MKDVMIKIENVSKTYRLGEIGGTTLKETLQRLGAKIRKKEDPTARIGAKTYGKAKKFSALVGVSFEVGRGERVGIIGANGAGKSTLLKLISRITAPSGGAIYLNGRVASMLEVGTGFHPELTGRENIYISGAVLGMTKKEIDRKIEDIIEFSEVREFIDTPVKRYSSGMYVKLAFSVAAHLDSEIMIMDEVLAVGDMAFQKKCVDKMRLVSDKQQRTVLYVSHNMGTIRDLCDRVIVLDKGRVIFDGDAEKGIALYMSAVAGAQKTEVDLSVMPRHHLTDYKMKLLKVALVGKNEAVVTRGEKLTVKTDWLAEEDRAAVRLIVAVRSALDNVAVASMMSAPLCDVKAGGRYTATIAADTTPLVAGSYFFNLLLVQASGEGGVVVLDFVARCVSLEVVEKNKDDLAADREYRALGHIRLPEPETLCAEEIFKGEEKL